MWGVSPAWAIRNRAARNVLYKSCGRHKPTFLLGVCLGVALWDRRAGGGFVLVDKPRFSGLQRTLGCLLWPPQLSFQTIHSLSLHCPGNWDYETRRCKGASPPSPGECHLTSWFRVGGTPVQRERQGGHSLFQLGLFLGRKSFHPVW